MQASPKFSGCPTKPELILESQAVYFPKEMDHKKTIQKYYRRIQAQDYKGILALFSKKGWVVHPVFGKRGAGPFFKRLLSVSVVNRTRIKNLFVDPKQPNRVAAYLSDQVKTNEGEKYAIPHIVHVFDFSKEGTIKQITVIFDIWPFRKFLGG